jgi:menaquinone-specific isochorismate synthase
VLADRDPDCFVFACAGLIGATPELLIQREGRRVCSRVIAGTAARGSGPCEDAAISAALAASAKEAEEHRYAVVAMSTQTGPAVARVNGPT